MKFRIFAYQHPVLIAWILLVICIIVQNLLSLVSSVTLVNAMVSELAIAIIAVAYIYFLNNKGPFKTPLKDFGYALKYAWFPILLNVALATAGIVDKINNGGTIVDNAFLVFIGLLIYTLAVGVYEEVMFRGIFFSAFLKKRGDTLSGIVKACVFNSLVFGIVHVWLDLILAFIRPGTFTPTFVVEFIGKILQTGLFGFWLSVLILRTHNLWIAALVHAINDLPVTITSFLFQLGGESNYTNLGFDLTGSLLVYTMYIVVQIPVVIYACFQLKKVTLPQWGMDKVCWFPISSKKKNQNSMLFSK